MFFPIENMQYENSSNQRKNRKLIKGLESVVLNRLNNKDLK